MPPGLIGSELSATPPQYLQSEMEESSLFPPISRKSAISLGSETDPSDYCNPSDRKSQTRGSVPASLSSTPLKFPTIDRANSTSIASLPGSRSTRHRSVSRDLRSSYCRSPSCPSNLNIRRDFNNDANIYIRKESTDEGELNDLSAREDKVSLLPSIFSKDSSPRMDKSSSRRDKSKDRTNTLSIRRTESFMHPRHPVSDQNLSQTSREMEQRQGQAAALLLPIRNTTQTNKKKKKRRARMSSDSEAETLENTPRNFDLENNKSRLRYNRSSEDALDVIARENELYDDDMDTPRAIEISSSRKVKQWMSNNKHSHSESEIKA